MQKILIVEDDEKLRDELEIFLNKNGYEAQSLKVFDNSINNIFETNELDEKTSVGISDKSTGRRKSKIYNLDVIISVGYRVKSKNGVIFRQWVNKILKDYMLKGYAVNQKRL